MFPGDQVYASYYISFFKVNPMGFLGAFLLCPLLSRMEDLDSNSAPQQQSTQLSNYAVEQITPYFQSLQLTGVTTQFIQ